MLMENIQRELNKQLNAELYSGYLYLAMEAYFQSINLSGFANWMRVQAQEELVHAIKFYDFINERGGRVLLDIIDKPQAEWKSPLDAFETAYNHEKSVTVLINYIVELSQLEKDYATYNFLQWFVSEQVEEEASTDGVVQKLKLVGDQGSGIFMIDNELKKRVFVSPQQQDSLDAK
ncbi:MAG: ferritin [Spirochaetota bacterium]|nr:ferritin [Spirochaetota bacterium]